MPGPCIHYIISKKVPNELVERLGPKYLNVANALTSKRDKPYLSFGSVGPDFLFFHLKDANPVLADLANLYLDIADFIEDFREKLLELIPDELIQLAQAIDAVQNQVTQRSVLLTELREGLLDAKQVLDGLLTTVTEATTNHITDAIDVFNLIAHPVQDGQPSKDWWWFDTLHYRRTGKFAKFLLDETKPGTSEHSYAIGYLSHIAGDLVGHPYVNLLTGGPYRTHPQRHKLVENFNDTWAMNHYLLQELAYSNLHNDFDFRLPHNNLPLKIKKLLETAISKVYGNDFGRSIDMDDIETAYRLWYTWFTKSTGSGAIPKPQPYSLDREFAQAWATFSNNASDAIDMVGDAFSSAGGGILGFLAALAAAILAAVVLAVAIIDFILGTLTTIAMAPVRVFLSIMYEALYEAFLNYRLGVALNGLAFPFRSHLNLPNVIHLNNPRHSDNRNITATNIFNRYPRTKDNSTDLEKHLLYPLTRVERNATTPSPRIYLNHQPNLFIDGPLSFNDQVLPFIEQMSENPSDLHDLSNRMEREQLGNAVRLTSEFYRIIVDQKLTIPDFNLDGDRGIGYKSWGKGNDEDPRPPLGIQVDPISFI